MALIVDGNRIAFEEYARLKELDADQSQALDLYEFLEAWYSEDEHICVKTSGSTGNPKVIHLKKTAMLASAKNTAAYFQFLPFQTALLSLPIRFIAGKMMVVRSIISEMDLTVRNPNSSPLAGINEAYDFIPMTPHQFSYSSVMDLNRVTKILLGGGPITSNTLRKVSEIETEVYHGFGMTETITHIALRKLSGTNTAAIYHSLPGVELAVDSESRLQIQSHYFDTVTTNDLVVLKDKQSFRWLGRYDNVINSGGIKLFPEQIESKLSDHLDTPFFITSEPDELLGERVVVVIETEAIADEVSLRVLLNSTLEKYERPKKVYFAASFLRTENGKIQRTKTFEKLRNL